MNSIIVSSRKAPPEISVVNLLSVLGILLGSNNERLYVYEDWLGAYRPAVWKLLGGESPYSIPTFFNPPWTLLLLLPFTVLPAKLGYLALTCTGLLAYASVAGIRGAKRLTLGRFLFSLSSFAAVNLREAYWNMTMGPMSNPFVLVTLISFSLSLYMRTFCVVCNSYQLFGKPELIRS